MNVDVVMLSRLQFAATALYHFLFVPLTIGLVVLIAMMETQWVRTRQPIWREMTKFWGVLFGINFAMGVATGITMEFQFGTNWAYYAHYVGDVFGAALAIEGMMAFFLEATFVGLFFFGWDKLSPAKHLMCTWFLALGTTLSALWILIANAWMQHPVGAAFNMDTMRMEVTDFWALVLSPTALLKFLHTISGCYVTGSVFVLSISAWYLIKNRHQELATRSIKLASIFGFVAVLGSIGFGDESGFLIGKTQPMKLAAMEAEWVTEVPPAALTLIGWPDQEKRETLFAVKIPAALGFLATRSFDKPVEGIETLIYKAQKRIQGGVIAYRALANIKNNKDPDLWKAVFDRYKHDMGYALLLKRYTSDIATATDQMVAKAAEDAVPPVALTFWSFRVMVGCGLAMLGIFSLSLFLIWRKKLETSRLLQWVAFLALPLPWIASEAGWIVAEVGRQPWSIDGILPTFLSASSTSTQNVVLSLAGFVLFYSTLLIVDITLMIKAVRLGPHKEG